LARNTLRSKLVNLDGDQQELLKAKALRLAITPSSDEHSSSVAVEIVLMLDFRLICSDFQPT
jgi:hypothetical protein